MEWHLVYSDIMGITDPVRWRNLDCTILESGF